MRLTYLSQRRVIGAVAVLALTAGAATVATQSSFAAGSKFAVAPATGAGGSSTSTTTTQIVNITGTGFTDASGASIVGTAGTFGSGVGGVQINAASTCPSTPATADGTTVVNLTTGNFQVVSGTRIVANMPTLALAGTSPNFTSKPYVACVYDNTGSSGAAGALIGGAAYTVYPQPKVASVTPASGSLVGGQTVTVIGDNFTAKSSASINGVALTNVKVAKDLKSLTGVIPAQSTIPQATFGGNSGTVLIGGSTYNLVVNTEGGASTYKTSATDDDYKYVNAVSVSPSVVKVAGGTNIVIKGTGFLTTLAATATGAPGTNASVYFVKGQYDGTDDGGSPSAKVLAETGACTNVKVLSDTEVVCTTPALATGSYTVTLVSDNRKTTGTTTTLYQTVVSSSATVTSAAF